MDNPLDDHFDNRIRAIRTLLQIEIAYLHVHNRDNHSLDVAAWQANLTHALLMLSPDRPASNDTPPDVDPEPEPPPTTTPGPKFNYHPV